MDIYFKSVGRGTPLLLNIPPNKEGKFADADVARLKEFRATLDQMYATDFAKGATVTASSTRKNHLYQASHLTDGKDDTSWALANDAKTGEFTVDLGQKRRFDVVELKEDIAKGQRISGFKVEVELNGRWVPYGEGSTVGYRRLVQGQPVEAQKIRVTITNSQATPILTNFSVYKTPSSIEKTDGYPLGLDYHSNTTADKANTTWYDESEGVRGTSMWTNQKDASVTYRSMELRLMSYLQWIQITVKCQFTWMVKRLQTYKRIMQLVNVARWFMKQMTWLQVNIPSNSLTKLVKLLQRKVSTRSQFW